MVNEVLNLQIIPSLFPEIINQLPPELAGNLGNLITILKAVGIIFIIYFIFLITNIIMNLKRNKRIKEIERNVNEINNKLDILLKKSHIEKSDKKEHKKLKKK